MVDQNEAYTFQKRGIFYFSKRVPSDLREFYKVSRLTYSLKTKCPKLAKTKVRDAIHKLELYWNKVRMDKELPCSQSILFFPLPSKVKLKVLERVLLWLRVWSLML